MKLEINIPTSLQEIPLQSYQKFVKLATDSNDEEFVSQKMVEIFCGLQLKDVLKINYADVIELVESFDKLFKQKTPFVERFKVNDIEFGFIPDLENISYGEYIDIDKYIHDLETYHKAMAVLYRPIVKKLGNKYEIEPYQGSHVYSELMKLAPVNIALGCKVFFYNLKRELLRASLLYSENQLKVLTSSAKSTNLQNNGDGIRAYMRWLKATLQSLTPLQENHLESVLHTLLLKNKKQKLNLEN